MPFRSKAQQRLMFAKHPRIAKRWAREMKSEGASIKALPEKVAQSPANYWTGKAETNILEGAAPTTVRRDIHPPKPGAKNPQMKTAFDLAFSEEILKIAAGPSRSSAVRLARRSAPFAAKKIRGVRRRFRKARKGLVRK